MSFEEWIYVNNAYTGFLLLFGFILGFLVSGGIESLIFLIRVVFKIPKFKIPKKKKQD
ncbi:MAG: hypothetical protein K2I93_06325 [Oscillospiraceae bacterium]|nr:hypothetical protein [Oscillospiraceae bacterium]